MGALRAWSRLTCATRCFARTWTTYAPWCCKVTRSARPSTQNKQRGSPPVQTPRWPVGALSLALRVTCLRSYVIDMVPSVELLNLSGAVVAATTSARAVAGKFVRSQAAEGLVREVSHVNAEVCPGAATYSRVAVLVFQLNEAAREMAQEFPQYGRTVRPLHFVHQERMKARVRCGLAGWRDGRILRTPLCVMCSAGEGVMMTRRRSRLACPAALLRHLAQQPRLAQLVQERELLARPGALGPGVPAAKRPRRDPSESHSVLASTIPAHAHPFRLTACGQICSEDSG